MEFIFVFSIILGKVFLIHFFKIVEIVRTFWVNAFMYAEELTVFFWNEGISTVRTGKAERCCDDFAGGEGLTTDFTLVLTVTTVIVVDVVMWGATQRTDDILRNGFTIAALNWFYRFTVFPLVVFQKKLPILFDNRKLINFKFWILGRMRVIKSPLFERYMSANKVKKPADLFMLVLNVVE